MTMQTDRPAAALALRASHPRPPALEVLDVVFEDAIFHKRCTSNPAAVVRWKMREAAPRSQAGQFAAVPYRDAPKVLARVREAQGTAARCLEFAVPPAARTGESLLAHFTSDSRPGGVHTSLPRALYWAGALAISAAFATPTGQGVSILAARSPAR